MTEIVIDIETLPGDLSNVESDIAEIAETGKVSCPHKTKGAIIESLGGDGQLKYKTVDELKELWCQENKLLAAEQAYRKRSFDGTYGRVLSIAFGKTDEEKVHSYSSFNEDIMLAWFVETIKSICTRKDGGFKMPFFIAHNAIFDLKFLFRRLVINNLKFGFDLPFNGWHDKNFYCTSQAWCEKGERVSQDNLCKALGIEGKPQHIDGSQVFDYARKGELKEIEEYNIDDVIKCRQIYNRLKGRV